MEEGPTKEGFGVRGGDDPPGYLVGDTQTPGGRRLDEIGVPDLAGEGSARELEAAHDVGEGGGDIE